MSFDASCEETLEALEAACLRRHLRPLQGRAGHELMVDTEGATRLCFASNDYLGLAHDPRLVQAAQRALEEYGVGSGASRLITGTHPAHVALEEAIAEFKGVEAALCFATGYSAAMGFATAFLDRSSIVLLDKLCHASLIDACRLVGARLRVFRHNDMDKLRSLLEWARAKSPTGRVVVMTESVFSMDGDTAPLRDLVELKEVFGAELFIDEAHAVGVLGPGGRGLASELNLVDRVDVHMGTLGKAVGVAGGYLAGSRPMIEVLLNRARSFVYSTAPPPALAEAARTSLAIVAGDEGEQRRVRLRSSVRRLSRNLEIEPPVAAIAPWIVGGEAAAMGMAEVLADAGFSVPAIRYPSVARGSARLRITVSSAHTEAQIDSLTQAILAYRSGHEPTDRPQC